jgi:hypothetical protein
MASESRAKYIKALAEKFIKLVESLEPGERLSITKVSAHKPSRTQAKRSPKAKPKTAKRSSH